MANNSDSNSSKHFKVLLCVILCLLFPFTWAGSKYLLNRKHTEPTYKRTMCFVKNAIIVTSNCSIQKCQTGEANTHCYTEYYTCYNETYTVIYNTTDGRELESTLTITDEPKAQLVSMRYRA